MRNHRNQTLLISTLLLGLLLVCTGCPSGDDPAEAMLRDFNANNPAASPAGNNAPAGGTQQAAAGANGAAQAAQPGAAGAEENPCNPCAEAEDDYDGPKVTITIESIENGIPEYEGKAKYDIRVEAQSDEVPPTPGVWLFTAFDENGEKVGEAKKHMKIPSAYPKIISLNGFYCTSKPVDIKVRRTEGTGMTVEEAQAGAGQDSGDGGVSRGAGGGGGGNTGGRGAAGGGGSGGSDDEDDPISDDE